MPKLDNDLKAKAMNKKLLLRSKAVKPMGKVTTGKPSNEIAPV